MELEELLEHRLVADLVEHDLRVHHFVLLHIDARERHVEVGVVGRGVDRVDQNVFGLGVVAGIPVGLGQLDRGLHVRGLEPVGVVVPGDGVGVLFGLHPAVAELDEDAGGDVSAVLEEEPVGGDQQHQHQHQRKNDFQGFSHAQDSFCGGGKGPPAVQFVKEIQYIIQCFDQTVKC